METINSIIFILLGLIGLFKRKRISSAVLSHHLNIWGKEAFNKKTNYRNFLLAQTIMVIIGGAFIMGGLYLFFRDAIE